MHLILERADLLKSLSHAQSVVERRNTIFILGNVLLNASAEATDITATDMEIEIRERVPAEVRTAGSVTAPAHMLYEIVRKLPEGSQVEIKTDKSGDRITLSAGRSRFKLGTLPVSDFPQMPAGDLGRRFAMTAGDLRQLIDRTKFAISTEETRYYLNGIYLHATDGGEGNQVLRAVATDGHRMARFELPAPKGAEDMAGIIVPRKTMMEVRKLLEESNDDVNLELSESKIRFTFGEGLVLASKLIDGTFPNYERVIPSNQDKSLSAPTKDLAAAVDRVATIAASERIARGVKLALSSGRLVVSAESSETGSATEELDAVYEGENLEIGFNARYLLDVLQQVEGDRVLFGLTDSASPALVHDAATTKALFVLMPMRV